MSSVGDPSFREVPDRFSSFDSSGEKEPFPLDRPEVKKVDAVAQRNLAATEEDGSFESSFETKSFDGSSTSFFDTESTDDELLSEGLREGALSPGGYGLLLDEGEDSFGQDSTAPPSFATHKLRWNARKECWEMQERNTKNRVKRMALKFFKKIKSYSSEKEHIPELRVLVREAQDSGALLLHCLSPDNELSPFIRSDFIQNPTEYFSQNEECVAFFQSLSLEQQQSFLGEENFRLPLPLLRQCSESYVENLRQVLPNEGLEEGDLHALTIESLVQFAEMPALTKLSDGVQDKVRSHFGKNLTLPCQLKKCREASGLAKNEISYREKSEEERSSSEGITEATPVFTSAEVEGFQRIEKFEALSLEEKAEALNSDSFSVEERPRFVGSYLRHASKLLKKRLRAMQKDLGISPGKMGILESWVDDRTAKDLLQLIQAGEDLSVAREMLKKQKFPDEAKEKIATEVATMWGSLSCPQALQDHVKAKGREEKADKLLKAVLEIESTETTFRNRMCLLKAVLEAKKEGSTKISHKEQALLREGVTILDEAVRLSSEMSQELRFTTEEEHIPDLRLLFEGRSFSRMQYLAARLHYIMPDLKDFLGKDPKWNETLTEHADLLATSGVEVDNNALLQSPQALLIQLIQRPTRYSDLLEGVAKRLPEDSVRKTLCGALVAQARAGNAVYNILLGMPDVEPKAAGDSERLLGTFDTLFPGIRAEIGFV